MRCRSGNIINGYRCDDVAGSVLRINLADFDEPEMRARLLAVRTGLTLPRDQVDELVGAGEAMIRQHAAEIARFLRGQPNPLLRMSVAYPSIDNDRIGLAAPSPAPNAATGWRIWKYLRIAKHDAAAARCLRVCPLKRPPAE